MGIDLHLKTCSSEEERGLNIESTPLKSLLLFIRITESTKFIICIVKRIRRV